MKKEIILFLLILLAACAKNIVDDQTTYLDSNGIRREITKVTVAPGEELIVKLHINLLDNQTYYLAEERVPKDIVVLEGKPDKDNVLKIIKIQDAKSTVISYKIKAPDTPGSYTFTGEYALDGMKDPKEITGHNTLFVR